MADKEDDFSALFETFEGSAPRRQYTDEDRNVTWSDWGRNLLGGTANTLSGFAADAEWATDGAVGGDTRRALDAYAEGQVKQTSIANQDALAAKFIPDGVDDISVWDVGLGRALAAKAINTAPSLVAAIIPAGIAAKLLRGASVATRATVAGAVAKGTASAQNAGDVTGQIFKDIEKLDHKTLMQSPTYAGYVAEGYDPEVAKKKFMQDAVGIAPVIAGAVTYLTGGVEGQIGARLGGESAKGIIRGAATGAAKELVQESLESGSGEYLSQNPLIAENLSDRDWLKILNATVEGGLVGGALGAVGGGIGGIGKTNPGPLDPTTKYALDQKTQDQAPPPPAGQGEAVTQGVTTPPGTPGQETTPPTGEQAPPPPPPPSRAYTHFYNEALKRLDKNGIEVTPEIADELSQRVTEMVGANKDPKSRWAALGTILSDLNTRYAPKAEATSAPAAPTQQQADQAAMQAGIETLDAPVPERPKTLQMQVDMLKNGQRQAVFIPFTTPEAERPKKPKGFEKIPLTDGYVYYNPAAIKPAAIRKAAEAGRLNDILPMGGTSKADAVEAVKKRGADPKVVQVLKDGISVLDAASSSETVNEDVQKIAEQAPADTQVVVRNDPENVINERIEGREQDLAEQKEEPIVVTPELRAKWEELGTRTLPDGRRVLPNLTDEAIIQNELSERADAERRAKIEKQRVEREAAKFAAEFDNLVSEEKAQPVLEVKDATESKKGAKAVAKKKDDLATAKQILDTFAPTPAEAKGGKAYTRQAGQTRARKMLEAAERAKVKIPGQWREGVPEHLGFLLLVKKFVKLLNDPNADPAVVAKATDQFMSDEFYARQGEWENIKSTRQVEGGAQAKKKDLDENQQYDDDTRERGEIDIKKLGQTTGETEDERVGRSYALAEENPDQTEVFESGFASDEVTDEVTQAAPVTENVEEKLAARRAEGQFLKTEEAPTKAVAVEKKVGRPKLQVDKPKVEGKITLTKKSREIVAKASRRRDATFDDSSKKARVTENDDVVYDTWESRRNALEPLAAGTQEQRVAIGDIYNGVSDILLEEDIESLPAEQREQFFSMLDLVSDVASGRATFAAFVDEFVRASYVLAARYHKQVMELVPSLNKLVPQEAMNVGQQMVDVMRSYLNSNTNVDPILAARLQSTIDAYEGGRLTPYNLYREAFLGLTTQERESIPLEADLYNLRAEFSQIEEEQTSGMRLPLPEYETGKPVVADVFHGTGKKIKEFAKQFLGAYTGAPSAREAFFFARNPATANNYASFNSGGKPSDGHLLSTLTGLSDFGKLSEPEPARRWVQDHLAMMDEGQRAEFDRMIAEFHMNNRKFMLKGEDTDLFEAIVALLESAEGSGPNVIMGRIYMENPLVIDQKGERYREVKYYNAIVQAKKEGRDGVIFLNTFDGGPQDVIYAVFDNDQISQRFNPERDPLQVFPSQRKAPSEAAARALAEAYDMVDVFDQVTGGKYNPQDGIELMELIEGWEKLSAKQQALLGDTPLEYGAALNAATDEGWQRDPDLWLDEKFKRWDALPASEQSKFEEGFIQFLYNETAPDITGNLAPASMTQEDAVQQGMLIDPSTNVLMPALQVTTIAGMKPFLQNFNLIQNPVLREVTKFIWGRIDERIPDMKVMLMTADQIQRISKNADAFYTRVGQTDFIALAAEKINDPNYVTAVLTHEAVHGMTSLGIDSDPAFYNTIKLIADEVRSVIGDKRLSDLYGIKLKKEFNEKLSAQYGFTDAHEFIAEALSNPAFQKMLADIQISDKLARQLGMQTWSYRSLWSAIVNTVRKLLNMPPNTFTALEGVMRVTDSIMTTQEILPPTAQLLPPALNPKLITREAAMQAAQGFADAVTPTSIGKRKALLGLSTLDQIRQWYRGTFVNAKGEDLLEKLISNIQRIRPFADAKRERGEQLAQRFMDFAAKNREAANEFADIANSVTMLNAQLFGANEHWGSDRRDGWQARELLPDLQRRFAAIEQANPGARQLYDDMVAYYRDTQNEITRQLVDNILAEHDADLSDAARASLTKKVMEGTLDDAAKELVNNATIFNALKDARALRLVQGDYFPLMRHGDFVVQTRDSIGDLHGGVEVTPGVIEFTGKTEKEALKKAEAFAKRTTKGPGFTQADGVPLILSGPTATEVSSDSSEYKFRVKVQLDGLHMFDTQAEAESFIRSEKGKFAQISEAPLLKRDDGTFGGELSNSALAAIAKSISARDNIPQVQREMMLTALKQAAVRQMAGNRVQKRALPRRGFIGASDDLARNTLVYAEASTRYLGKLRYMPLVREAFSEMQKLTDEARYSKDHQVMDQLLQHMRARVDGNVITEQEASPLIRDVMTMSSIDKLASPAYSLIQTLQPTMMTLPYLSGRYGIGQAGAAIAQAYRVIGAGAAIGGGLRNTKQSIVQFAKTALDSTDVLGSIMANVAKEADGKQLTAVLNELVERGILDKNAGMEVAEVVTKGRGKWAMGLSKVDRITRQLPAAIEQVNRAVSAVAAYRLAVEKGESHEKAMSRAFDTVANTQGDYSASNAPAIFNHPIWRISLQFKKYGQMYYAMFGDMLYRAFKDASPEERAVARKQLAHVIGVQILAAGALGIPGMEVIKLGVMAAAALGIGGGYDDFEREVREAASAMFGKYAGELITKGVIPRAMGIDLSSRLGADSLLTFGEPKKYDETNVGAYLTNIFAGAPGSLIIDQFKAARGFADAARTGDSSQAWKSAELLPMPKFISDIAKASRKAIEGQTSSKSGRQTEEPIGLGTAALNAFGLRTADQAEKGAAKGAQIAEGERRREVTGSMTKLKNQFAEAKSEGERVRVLARLKQLNATLPEEERQTPAQFRAFAKKFQKDKAAGMVSGGARYRNEAEKAAADRAAAVYNYTR